MTLIKSVRIRNFKCFRTWQKFDFEQCTYFIGANNSGKSAVLIAIDCFFNSHKYDKEYINKNEFRAKGVGFNKSDIEIEFDLTKISTKTLKSQLIELYGNTLNLKHSFTFKEVSGQVVNDFEIAGNIVDFDNLPISLRNFLEKIAVSYIHPQESKELLVQAQLKLKNRLLSNWGRNAAIAETLKTLQTSWDDLRSKANTYLSGGLTHSLQDIWPGCITTVDLPAKIEDVVGISEILFKGNNSMPDVNLTSQGTGAQSTILYQTHYLLDSDKSLHRGFYHPIWLLEEPESFLHAEIISKLGNLLNSKLWLGNIQMIISSHSPILLATSKQSASMVIWNLLKNYEIKKSAPVNEWTNEEIDEVGVIMGDPNFKIYFEASLKSDIIFIEDKRPQTKDKFIESGINVTKALNGASELRRYFDVLRSIDFVQSNNSYFFIDNDDGVREFNNVIENENFDRTTVSGFKKYTFNGKVSLIVFPENYAVEDLFNEFDSFLESCANQLFSNDYSVATTNNIPANFSRVHAQIRNKNSDGLETAKLLIKKHQDIKDAFWEKITSEGWTICPRYIKEINSLMR